jgi:hypothetical protein
MELCGLVHFSICAFSLHGYSPQLVQPLWSLTQNFEALRERVTRAKDVTEAQLQEPIERH